MTEMSKVDRVSFALAAAEVALEETLGMLNMMAQRSILGLPQDEDNVRQKVSEALSILKGQIYCGNLTRRQATSAAMDKGITSEMIIDLARDSEKLQAIVLYYEAEF